ncbi:ATP-binding protein [Algoriphagus halophytocola]|uniref:histidine kinase n=1 Tax=Algoriphagus halophytocola TaxID=2991499 RepID=A0ABY6MI36_9BACT|nr:ATP-binding protein [Algoriphagus sp. TR-M5]UZD23457.1 ATP-binding protein [Algoriphagus sp. TR-M5]
MIVKDIVNRDIVNLTNCEQEPIHIPGSIQPHGFLLGLKQESFSIDFCSGNTEEFISQSHTKLLGKTLNEVFGDQVLAKLLDYIADNKMLSSLLLKLNLSDKEFLCTVHKSGTIYILEAEPVNDQAKQPHEVYDHTSQFLTYLHTTNSLKELCHLVAEGTREITGYDRVMIYRFDRNYNGEVFAESCRADLEPFLGLHYPHTDIPPQARDLYMKNLLRLITDIDYSPVPIYTIDDQEEKNLDLSLSILRSTSPIHVEYLQNMGVGATLTISLIYKNRLWGLIACHHYSPKNLTPEIRLAAQLQGHFITSQIDLRQSQEEYEIARKVNASFDKVDMFDLTVDNASFEELVKIPELITLCNAAGVSLVVDGVVYKSGLAPADDEVLFLADYFSEQTENSSFVTEKLIDHLPHRAELCGEIAGLIFHALDMDTNNCIIWYRPETKTEVKWAGDPSKSIIKDKKGLSPRRSFELWKEIVECTCKPWYQSEIEACAAYSYSLQRQLNMILLTKEEEKYRKLAELLKEKNAELENINWISSHDLQEPLRKIQLISSHLLAEEEVSSAVEHSLNRLNASAERMQTLLADIRKYSKLNASEDPFEEVELGVILEQVKRNALENAEAAVDISWDKLPVLRGVPFLIQQLFSNLISNSIKYAKKGVHLRIEITAWDEKLPFEKEDALYQVISVQDNGIGFEQKYADSIFNIFTKLHHASQYPGSGMGLALCKKIMRNHGGHIQAKGELGVGTEIMLYFPVS